MAGRGWGGSIATAIGVAAGTGAAQLGLGYGLGVISWRVTADAPGDSAWVASLAWTTWIAATSAILGAICADRLGPAASSTLDNRGGALARQLWRVALTLAAAIGALIVVPLVAVPARGAVRADTSAPHTIAGGYAVLGVFIGLVIAIGALASRAVAANAVASISWLWLLAVVAVVDGVAAGRGLAPAQLGVWEFTQSGPIVRNIDVPRALLTLGAALLIGALAALPAARRGDSGVGVAFSGGVGPLLVAIAYFLAAPTFVRGIDPTELSAHYVAPWAVIAGILGSVGVAVFGPRLQRASAPAGPTVPGGPMPREAESPLTDPRSVGLRPDDAGAARGQAAVATARPPVAATAAPATEAGGGARAGQSKRDRGR